MLPFYKMPFKEQISVFRGKELRFFRVPPKLRFSGCRGACVLMSLSPLGARSLLAPCCASSLRGLLAGLRAFACFLKNIIPFPSHPPARFALRKLHAQSRLVSEFKLRGPRRVFFSEQGCSYVRACFFQGSVSGGCPISGSEPLL